MTRLPVAIETAVELMNCVALNSKFEYLNGEFKIKNGKIDPPFELNISHRVSEAIRAFIRERNFTNTSGINTINTKNFRYFWY